MAAFESSKRDILESLHHPCYCLECHVVLQILGFRVRDGLEVLRREGPTQGQSSCRSGGSTSRSIFVDQEGFGWFIMGAGLCSSTTGTDRGCEGGGSSQLKSGFIHRSRACGTDVLCYRGPEKSEGSPFPLHSSQTQSPNCGFSITVSSP